MRACACGERRNTRCACPRQREVVGELVAAGQQAVVLDAADGLAAAEARVAWVWSVIAGIFGGKMRRAADPLAASTAILPFLTPPMTALIAGLVLFLGVHSVRIFADDWRTAQVARMGAAALEAPLLAGVARRASRSSSGATARRAWTRSSSGSRRCGRATLASLLVLPAFVLIVAGNMRGTRMKAALGIIRWCSAPSSGRSRTCSRTARSPTSCCSAASSCGRSPTTRRRAAATAPRAPSIRRARLSRDALAVVIGVVAWAVFGFWLHGWLIGVRPF